MIFLGIFITTVDYSGPSYKVWPVAVFAYRLHSWDSDKERERLEQIMIVTLEDWGK